MVVERGVGDQPVAVEQEARVDEDVTTKEGDPPRWIPFFLTAALVDRTARARFNDRKVDQTFAGTPS